MFGREKFKKAEPASRCTHPRHYQNLDDFEGVEKEVNYDVWVKNIREQGGKSLENLCRVCFTVEGINGNII